MITHKQDEHVTSLEIYCDGAFSSLRQLGGWAIVVIRNGEKIHSSFFPISGGTNNTAEIQAVLEAINWAKENNYNNLTILTDSMYVIGTASKGWKRNKNIELLANLDKAMENLKIEFKHVKGHEGNKWNELCDALAVQATFIT